MTDSLDPAERLRTALAWRDTYPQGELEWEEANDAVLVAARALLAALPGMLDQARLQVWDTVGAKIKDELDHAEFNGHHLGRECQGVDPFQMLPDAVRSESIEAALAGAARQLGITYVPDEDRRKSAAEARHSQEQGETT